MRAKYQGVLDDDSTYKLDRTCENCGTETFCMMQKVDAIIYTAGLIYTQMSCTSEITFPNVASHL